MNKYVYSESKESNIPEIKVILGRSYNDAVEKLIEKYTNSLDEYDEELPNISTWDDLQAHLYERYDIIISDLIDIDEL